MEMKNRTLIAADGLKIYCYIFKPLNREPKGIVQIVHGIGEHAGRYIEFATKLAKNGYVVCAEDHRGFGRTAISKEQIGHISDSNGHNLIINDMYTLISHVRIEYPKLPYFIFGHSMGSFLARSFMIKHPSIISGIILSATKGKKQFVENFGPFIANFQKSIFGVRAKAKLLHYMSIGNYGKKYFKKEKSSKAWLTSDEGMRQELREDEYYAKTPPSIETYIQLFNMLDEIEGKENIQKINKNIPILLIAGEKDPVGNFGLGVKWLYELYRNIGINDVEIKLYEEGRHELLKDKCRYDAIDFMLNWLNERVPTKPESN